MRRAARRGLGLLSGVLLIETALIVLVAGNLESCVAVGRSLKWMGDRIIQLGGAVVLGGIAWLLYPVGLAGVALATGVASLWTALMQPTITDKNGNVAGPDRLTWILVGAGAALLIRAWAHYPDIFRNAWSLTRTTARGLLGGLQKRLPELPPEAEEIKP